MLITAQTAGRFEYTGTRDYTAFATLPAALRFVETELGGLAAMREYNKNLLHAGCNLLKEKWGSYFLVSFPCVLSNMRVVYCFSYMLV